MDDWKLPWTGGCMCGQVRFTVSAPPLLTMACHCLGCQKLTASAFSLSLAVPAEGFAVTQGETVRGGLHGGHRQMYCAHCKNWLFTHAEGLDFFVNVRASALDDHAWFVPFIETVMDEKLSWATTPARHRFQGFPTLDEYTPVIEDFAREGVRPG